MDMDIDGNPNIEDLNTQWLELSLETEQEKALRVSIVANQQETTRLMNINNEAPPSHVHHENDVINIQLLYDPQALTGPELWSGSFHPIFLHGLIKHLASDSRNIKVTLNSLAKYILNKNVSSAKVNDLKDLDGMGDAIWNFISAVYKARWDALFTD